MTKMLNGLKLSLSISLIVGLLFSAGVFGMLLYAKVSGRDLPILLAKSDNDTVNSLSFSDEATTDGSSNATPSDALNLSVDVLAAETVKEPLPLPPHVLLEAPAISQYPELPAGCEVTSLAMLLQYDGIQKNKMDLVSELPTDPTPLRRNKNGAIAYWGNPNTGFVGDITKGRTGFGIYHNGLIDLLKKYIPEGIDMTGDPFPRLERQIANKIPVIVWTTINFQMPKTWVTWDTPLGKIRTTFSEHAVLLVGYDADNVYVNNPSNGEKNVKINKEQFIKTWKVMGKQALSYEKDKSTY